jgi:hypothetical protein
MFIKWKHRCWRQWWSWGPIRLRENRIRTTSAALVKSVRTPMGPRHKYICFLGSATEDLKGYAWGKEWFWETALRKLDQAGITGADREKITAALEKVVPRPEPD